MSTFVSVTNHQRNGFSKSKSESANRAAVSPKPLPTKKYARSPYREKTVMLRVPVSLMAEFRQRLLQHRQRVAAGSHDDWD